MPEAIGAAFPLELIIPTNADTLFSVEWWEDEDNTVPVAITGGTGAIKESSIAGAGTILDLTPFITAEDNVLFVVIPKETAELLTPVQGAYWDLVVTAGGTDFRTLAGSAAIIQGAS